MPEIDLNIKSKIDKRAYEEVLQKLIALNIETQRANQTMKEFSATLESIRVQYHPFIWWILSAFRKK